MKYRTLGKSLYIKGRIGWKGLKKSEYLYHSNYRIINGSNIKNGHINWVKSGYISKARYIESPEIMLKNNDILISKDGTIGKVAMVKHMSKPSTIASGLFLIRNIKPKIWNTNFLYYIFNSNLFTTFIKKRTEGSVVPHLYQKDFKQMKIPAYSLRYQNYVTSVLSPLDSMITLDNKINKNLIKLACSLFIKWIRNTKSTNYADLQDIAHYQNGIAIKHFPPKNDNDIQSAIKIRELRQGFTDNKSDTVSKHIKPSVEVHNGDILFSWSASLLIKIWYGGTAGLNQHLFKVTSSKYPRWFYFMWTLHYIGKFRKIAKDKATTMGHIKRSDLNKSQVIIPNKSEWNKLNNIFMPIFKMFNHNKIENKTLNHLKHDLLLKFFN